MLLISMHPLNQLPSAPKLKLSLSALATLPIVREGRTRSGDIVSVLPTQRREGAY